MVKNTEDFIIKLSPNEKFVSRPLSFEEMNATNYEDNYLTFNREEEKDEDKVEPRDITDDPQEAERLKEEHQDDENSSSESEEESDSSSSSDSSDSSSSDDDADDSDENSDEKDEGDDKDDKSDDKDKDEEEKKEDDSEKKDEKPSSDEDSVPSQTEKPSAEEVAAESYLDSILGKNALNYQYSVEHYAYDEEQRHSPLSFEEFSSNAEREEKLKEVKSVLRELMYKRDLSLEEYSSLSERLYHLSGFPAKKGKIESVTRNTRRDLFDLGVKIKEEIEGCHT